MPNATVLLHTLTLAGILTLNAQLYLGMLPAGEPVAAATAPEAGRLPDHIVERLNEADRMRAENAALQVIIKHATFTQIANDSNAQGAAVTAGATPAYPFTLPALPIASDTSAPPAAQPPAGAATPKPIKPEKSLNIVFKPIRLREDGSLLYLAADGNIRVVAPGGNLYAVNGVFHGVKDGLALFTLNGRNVPMRLLEDKT